MHITVEALNTGDSASPQQPDLGAKEAVSHAPQGKEEVKQQNSICDSSPNLGAVALGIGSLQIGKPSLFGKKKSIAGGGGLASKRDLFKNKLL